MTLEHESVAPSDQSAGDYDRLPPCLRFGITPKEWQWLPDDAKARYVTENTEPDAV